MSATESSDNSQNKGRTLPGAYHAKVVPRATPNHDGVWVVLPHDFQIRRVKKGDSIWDRGDELFGPDHRVVSFREGQPSLNPDFGSVEEWRSSLC